jgi:hypothetical protein
MCGACGVHVRVRRVRVRVRVRVCGGVFVLRVHCLIFCVVCVRCLRMAQSIVRDLHFYIMLSECRWFEF